MKTTLPLLLISCVLLAGCCCAAQHRQTAWEYRLLGKPTEADLNKLAAEGWEVQSFERDPDGYSQFLMRRSRK